MDVIALVGASGTGKSHRALLVAHKYDADAIIDDGILIKDGRIIAGQSAKREKNRIMAVRRAIFILPGHAEEVRAAIKNENPHRILILGTSENMIHKIAKRLGLPSVEQIIHIEDIASKTDMAKAEFYRRKEGKHIIPVPTIELKPHFSGYLVDPIQSLFNRSSRKRRKLGEKSIVRPIFSYYGKLIIDDSAVKSIVKRMAMDRGDISKVGHVKVTHLMDGNDDNGIEISCEVVLRYGKHIPTLISDSQKKIKEAIEYMTGIVVQTVNINVRTLFVMPA
ncbi:MAG: Asp23/Gls24 family envelope stress response protein [Schwartzia sp.]|nr:Asp23/Gls24 family envelope stress response protein [Schwartzia sp. (in: firmicutes)]